MSNSEAFYNNDSGFYVGQTPPQKGRVKRTIVKNVKSWGNVLGFSGTNMRYVTITKSQWYNNGAGIVPNALDSEKYPPPERQRDRRQRHLLEQLQLLLRGAVRDPGDVGGRRFRTRSASGILLFGSQDTTVENNRIFGNWLGGFAEIPAVQLAGSERSGAERGVGAAQQHRAQQRVRRSAAPT